jgi:Transposase DDE domain group 1
LPTTECNQSEFTFDALFSREVVGRFDGGQITSDGGGLLLREVERRTNILQRLADCFRDYRVADRIEHSVRELICQRVYALALGYEDLNDHDQLRADPLLAVLAGKRDPAGQDRKQERDRGKALAGKSTLNRWELTRAEATEQERYAQIVMDSAAIDRLLVEVFLEAYREAPEEIVLDLDATDDPLYGKQEGRFFHGYYGHYCYLPLYIFCGEHLLCARLRPAHIDGSAGSLEEVERIVAQIRQHWPQVKIILRADSGFCRDALMSWCEHQQVDYVLGLARNARLRQSLDAEMEQARALHAQTHQTARLFTEFSYQTHESWSSSRRVIAKVEYLDKGENPRFVVTSLSAERMAPQPLYEQLYCARGEMENRSKEQFSLFSDRTSTAYLRSNQLRLYLSSIAYLLLQSLRRLGLQGTAMAQAQCQTIRLKLLKIGALVRVSVRKVWVCFSSGYPDQVLFAHVFHRLRR